MSRRNLLAILCLSLSFFLANSSLFSLFFWPFCLYREAFFLCVSSAFEFIIVFPFFLQYKDTNNRGEGLIFSFFGKIASIFDILIFALFSF